MSKELRLIELACGPIAKGGQSASDVRANVEQARKRLAEVRALLDDLKYEMDFVVAILSLPDHYAVRAHEGSLKLMAQDLAEISDVSASTRMSFCMFQKSLSHCFALCPGDG